MRIADARADSRRAPVQLGAAVESHGQVGSGRIVFREAGIGLPGGRAICSRAAGHARGCAEHDTAGLGY